MDEYMFIKQQTMQARYQKYMSSIYHGWALAFVHRFLWRCPTDLIGQQFNALTSANHLDVGGGTGYYMKKHLPQRMKRIALVDMNQKRLDSSVHSIEPQFHPEVYCCNVLEPLALHGDRFDSVSMNSLLHCLPGTITQKAIIFNHLNDVMNPGAVLFGCTVLGRGTPKNQFAQTLMAFYNRKGIFSNTNDEVHELHRALNVHFSDVKMNLFGCVAIFSGKKQAV